MDFELSEQHKMLKSTVHDFVAKEIVPIAAQIDKSGELPWDCVKKMGELGLFGMLIPPAFGGTGPDRLGFLIAVEEIATGCAGLALAMGMSSAVAVTILELGSDEQKRQYLPAMARGERLGALAAVEPSGGANYPVTLQTGARLVDESYVVNGTKCFISNGGEAEVYLVLARTDPQKGPLGIACLIVEKGTPGFSFGRSDNKLGLRANVTRELIFQDCRVPRGSLLAEGFLVKANAMAAVAMPALGAISLGLARASLEAAIDYVKQRTVTPNQTLAKFDTVQGAIANMITLVETARAVIYQAGAVPLGKPDPTPFLVAGIFPCESAIEVTNQALQLFGTYGYTADFPVERYFRDARGLLLVAQPMELRKLFLGRIKLGLPPM